VTGEARASRETARLLGLAPGERALIINADDAGLCHSVNQAVIAALEEGLVTSASLMAPSPWLPELAEWARANSEHDLGVHLTLTCEWRPYRWRPLTGSPSVPSLCAPDGAMWPTHEQLREHACAEEVALEARSQIEHCLELGIDVTHVDSHMDALLYDRRFQRVLLELGQEYGLPVRLFPQSVLGEIGTPDLREEARRRRLLFAENLILPDTDRDTAEFWAATVADLPPGISEAFIHIGLGDAEIIAITDGDARLEEYRLFGPDGAMGKALRESGVRLMGHRPLRELQRSLGRTPRRER